jgi:hypothetical protein
MASLEKKTELSPEKMNFLPFLEENSLLIMRVHAGSLYQPTPWVVKLKI